MYNNVVPDTTQFGRVAASGVGVVIPNYRGFFLDDGILALGAIL